MIPKIDYYMFTELEDALRFLDMNPDSKILSGGTDLVVQMRSGKTKIRKIVDISRINDLKYIREDRDSIKIGPLTTIEELKNSLIIEKWAPPLWRAAKEFGTWHVRNIATIGGNICNASPAADTVPPLITLKSSLVLTSIRDKRKILVEDFFRGPGETVIEGREILTEIVIPKLDGEWSFSFIKLGKRMGHILSIVSVAAGLMIDDERIEDVIVSLGSVAPTPIRSKSVEEYLKGRRASIENIDEASLQVVKDVKPISDVRASAEYRIEMSKVLVRRALRECLKGLKS
ncbi:MAG: xanthine dehydrogenase family protein subunit M [Candidatus Caldarchaeales archaeon]